MFNICAIEHSRMNWSLHVLCDVETCSVANHSTCEPKTSHMQAYNALRRCCVGVMYKHTENALTLNVYHWKRLYRPRWCVSRMRNVYIFHLMWLRHISARPRLYRSSHPAVRRQQRRPSSSVKIDNIDNTQPTPAPHWWADCIDVKSPPETEHPRLRCPWWDAHHQHHPSASVRLQRHLSCGPWSPHLRQELRKVLELSAQDPAAVM